MTSLLTDPDMSPRQFAMIWPQLLQGRQLTSISITHKLSLVHVKQLSLAWPYLQKISLGCFGLSNIYPILQSLAQLAGLREVRVLCVDPSFITFDSFEDLPPAHRKWMKLRIVFDRKLKNKEFNFCCGRPVESLSPPIPLVNSRKRR